MLIYYIFMVAGSFTLVYLLIKMQVVAKTSVENKKTIEQLEHKLDLIINSMQFIKFDNLVTMNNALAKYREGFYEDEYFIQEVGECKILKITDKSNGETTLITYDSKGQIEQTNTYIDGVLLSTMEYVNGKLDTGNKYHQDGQKDFSYKYNEFGEVVSQKEYLYGENNQFEIKETIF